jgi:hypothetical protein
MRTVPLRDRKVDFLFLAFFVVNLVFITYMIDLEQLVIRDPAHFTYPIWPPAPLIDLMHWYGNHYDPLLMARPPFWRMTIWIDVIYFGPFYAAAIYAFLRGRNWIKVPALVWSGLMLANVLIILMDERYGVTPAPNFGLVVAANAPWLLLPFAVIFRLRRDQPFSRPIDGPIDGSTEPAAAAVPG